MTSIQQNLTDINAQIAGRARLVAVSKTKPILQINEAYQAGQRDFGENYVQELVEKFTQLPADIQWHMIGHLQSNKVKLIAPFVQWIHSVDSEKLLAEIHKQALKNDRKINCLLQIHIAKEETKFGFTLDEARQIFSSTNFSEYSHAPVCGLMAMASFTEDENQIRNEFKSLKNLFDELKVSVFKYSEHFNELSFGMTSDWKIAIAEGSTMLRIGSALFGNR